MLREEMDSQALPSHAHRANWDPQTADQGFKLRRAEGVWRMLLFPVDSLVSSRRLCYCSYCYWGTSLANLQQFSLNPWS